MSQSLKGTRILVPGGTGAMGVYLIEELSSAGAEIYVTTRRQLPSCDGVKYLIGNAHDNNFIEDCIRTTHPDVIVDFMNYKVDEFAQRVEVLTSAVGQYVFLSSYRVYADDELITENSPRLLDTSKDTEFLKTDLYPLAKARQEDLLRGCGNMNWTIVRPCSTYSKERFQFGCLEANTVCYRSLQGVPVVIPSAMLDKTTTMTWGGDVAKMIMALVCNNSAIGDVFNVVTSESHSWREVYGYYKDLIGMDAVETSIDDYEKIIGSHYYYQIHYDRMFDRRLDNSKILAVSGLKQSDFMSLKDGLSRELSWFRHHERYPFLNLPENARMDRYCGSQICIDSLTDEDKAQYMEVFNGAKQS